MKRLAFGFISALFFSCHGNVDLSHLNSADIASKEERIATLQKEIKSFSDILDAEYTLFNVNGFSNSRVDLPGASSRHYKFAIRVKPEDVNQWTGGMEEISEDDLDTTWHRTLLEKRKLDWQKKNSKPHFYKRGKEVRMTVYEKEGIIFKEVVNP